MNLDAGIIEVSLQDIIPNRFQPRLNFDEKALKELADSIKQHGIIQPLVLRKIGDKYEIIAGERRFRAAGMAGLMKIPAVIASIDDNTSAEVALVENIQRKDLTAIEEAKSYKNLLDKGYLTQDQLAKRLGLSQSAVSNKLRLLNLADEVQEALLGERISERHARALLQLEKKEDQVDWLNKVMRDRLTVRQLDMELKKLKQEEAKAESDIPLVNLTPDIEEIKEKAMDINPEPQPKVVEDFFPEAQTEDLKLEATTVVQNTAEATPRKFFNFLEDEAANLDTGQDLISKPLVQEPMIQPNVEQNTITPIEQVTSVPSTPIVELQTPETQFVPTPEPQSSLDTYQFDNSGVVMGDNTSQEPTVPTQIQPQQSANLYQFDNNGIITNDNNEETGTSSQIQPQTPVSPYQFDNSGVVTNDNNLPVQPAPIVPTPQPEPQFEILDMPIETPQQLESATSSYQFDNSGVVTNDNNLPVQPAPIVPTPQLEPQISPIQYNEGPQTIAPQYNESPVKQFDDTETLTPTDNIENESSTRIYYEPEKQEVNITDPVSMIDRLDPEYENRQAVERGQDLKTAIGMIRERAKEIENKGFLVEIDEIDFEDSYQMTIKIEKDN